MLVYERFSAVDGKPLDVTRYEKARRESTIDCLCFFFRYLLFNVAHSWAYNSILMTILVDVVLSVIA